MKRSCLILGLFFSFPILSECNFNTSDFIDDLIDPANIQNIEITIPKSKKWANNLFKIITDKSKNINPKFKNRFTGFVKVYYIYGACNFAAKIRVSGDWKDHLRLSNNGIISSIDIKLLEGNILNASRFKLLIPDTRNSLNEILGTLVLKRLNFITPETFIVKSSVNGVFATFLFQENAEKEMLERNLRREGPIFEGNESLLWSYKDHAPLELGDLSLSRLTNKSWANKGITSTQISLSAFLDLQKAYLEYTNDIFLKNPRHSNYYLNSKFDEYTILLLAMNGSHALAPHNRKFYFNSLSDSFEPIYYDGNFELSKAIDFNEINKSFNLSTFFAQIDSDKFQNYIFILNQLKESQKFYNDFENRAGNSNKKFFKSSINNIIKNLEFLVSRYELNENNFKKINRFSLEEVKKRFAQSHAEKNFKDFLIIENIQTEDNNYSVEYYDKSKNLIKMNITQQEIVQLMSESTLKDMRFELMPQANNLMKTNKKAINFLNGQIIHSDNTIVNIDYISKLISIDQNHPSSWILIKDLSLKNWSVRMQGSVKELPSVNTQRFNFFGLTGCLNFYNVFFSGVSLSLQNGVCEDSLNIVNSSGELKSIEIKNAYADAIDIDFSKISIKHLLINNAGNDCMDLSGGEYQVEVLTAITCIDKGISIGELSNFYLRKGYIADANIAISSKDLSNVRIDQLLTSDINICLEAFNKKQEFGGGKLLVSSLQCSGEFVQDKFSNIQILTRVE